MKCEFTWVLLSEHCIKLEETKLKPIWEPLLSDFVCVAQLSENYHQRHTTDWREFVGITPQEQCNGNLLWWKRNVMQMCWSICPVCAVCVYSGGHSAALLLYVYVRLDVCGGAAYLPYANRDAQCQPGPNEILLRNWLGLSCHHHRWGRYKCGRRNLYS